MDEVLELFQTMSLEEQAEIRLKISGLNENTAGIEVVNEARPSDQEDGTNIPLVKQVLLLDPDEINKDMETCTNTLDKIKLWGMKRKRVIQNLREAADYLTTLHKVSRRVDIVGTSVSAVSASGAAWALTAALFSTTAPVSIPACGAGTLIGGTVSTGSQLLKNYLTEERKKKLEKDLEKTAKDMTELKALMSNFDGASERLNKTRNVLKGIFQLGWTTEVVEKLCNGMSAENTKIVLQIVDKICNNDTFITYMTTFVLSTTSVGLNSVSGEIDWDCFIKSSAKIVSGLAAITMGPRIIEAVNEAECINLALRTTTAVTLVLSLVTIFMDVSHLVDLVCLDKKPEIIEEARELAELLQQNVDLMKSKYPTAIDSQ